MSTQNKVCGNQDQSTADSAIAWKANLSKKIKLSKEDALFIFGQAEKLLSESAKTSDIIINRTNTLITLVSGVLIGITAFTVKEYGEAHGLTNILITSFLGISYFYMLAIVLAWNAKTYPYCFPGSLPSKQFDDSFFSASIPDASRIIMLIVNETENYDLRIKVNNKLNRKRWLLYNISLIALLMSPLVLMTIFMVLSFTRLG